MRRLQKRPVIRGWISEAILRPSERGFDLLYQVTAPKRLILFSDECSHRVAAICPGNKRAQAMVLDERPPVFDVIDDSKGQEYRFPAYDSIWYCDVLTGAFNDEVSAHMLLLRDCSDEEFYKYAREIKLSHEPDNVAAFVWALDRSFWKDESEGLKIWLKERHPDHLRVLLDRAKGAARKQEDTVIHCLTINRPEMPG